MIDPIINRPDSVRLHHAATIHRAQYMGEMIATLVMWLASLPSKAKRFFQPVPSLSDCSNADDVIRYANSIRQTQPNFADELITAANSQR
jgi:hypothetical protein